MEKGKSRNVVKCSFEPLSYILNNGLRELSHEAFLEVEDGKEEYNPDWVGYQTQENNNILRFVSLRENGNLIGYA